MNRSRQSTSAQRTWVIRGLSVLAAAGSLALPLSASSVEVEHVTLEVEDVLGIPAIQAIITNCLGEQVYFTGTVRITLKDGIATHFNWAGMRGETADGDLFVAGSGVTVGKQSNQTIVEVGAGKDNRQFHLHILAGEVFVACHN